MLSIHFLGCKIIVKLMIIMTITYHGIVVGIKQNLVVNSDYSAWHLGYTSFSLHAF